MTADEIRRLIARLRDLAADQNDRGDADLARELHGFADGLEADLKSGELP